MSSRQEFYRSLTDPKSISLITRNMTDDYAKDGGTEGV